MRSHFVGNMASALTAQKFFLNNFENVVNCRVNIRKDIKHYQNTLSYALSKIDYSMVEGIYMLPSDMNLNNRAGTVRYNNKILVSDGMLSLGRNDMVNAVVPEKLSLKIPIILKHAHVSNTAMSKHSLATKVHEEEMVALLLVPSEIVRFSLMRGRRRGDPIHTSGFFLE